MSVLTIVQAMLVGAAGFLLLAAVGTIRYRVTEEALEVVMFWMVVRRISLADIEEVHRRGAFPHECWSGPRFWNAVTIRRRRGLLRSVIITPDDPDRFVADLASILEARRPGARTGAGARGADTRGADA
jgi:hypothetical protein